MSIESNRAADVIVAGTGPSGLLAALAFSASGFRVALIGPAANLSDARTTALMTPALDVLDGFGLLDGLRLEAAELRIMRIADATSRLIRSPVVTFHAGEIDQPYFGLNIPNRILNDLLEAKIDATTKITWHRAVVEAWHYDADCVTARFGDSTVSARLAVAADGRNSSARAASGIRTKPKSHPQSALALTFTHSRDHGSISTEFHTETGPFTQVPLPGKRSSLVWVVKPAEAARLAGLDLPALSRAVETRMQSMLGAVAVEAAPQVYPLSVSVPDSFARNRIALVGEAAHIFPPIGAQGLNLGIRDVVQLVEIAEQNREDPGADAALRDYDRRRRPDILARTAAVSLLNGSLLSSMLAAQMARSAGFNLLGTFSPLRNFFTREGLRPGSGFGSIASMIRQQMR